jgi:GntR family transcriptional regulator
VSAVQVSYLEAQGVRVPKYYRVKEALLERIANETLPPGALVPSELELCAEFGVSRITVRKAIGDLVHEGKLRAVQGKGTFVMRPKLQERFIQRAFGIYEDMERRGLRLSTTVLRQEVIPAPLEVAMRLQVPREERVHLLERVRSVEDERLLLSTTYIPALLCPGLVNDDLSSGSLYRLLRERYGLKIGRGERSLEAVAARQREAHLLDIALASPLLLLGTVAYLPDGRPFEYSVVLHRGDSARIEIEFLPAPDEM